MKNTRILAVVLSAFILASCGTSHDVVDGGLFQKRKYNKGYHISKKSKVSTKMNDDQEVASIIITNDNETINSIEHEPSSDNEVVTTVSNETIVATETNNTIYTEDSNTEKSNTSKLNKGVIAKNLRNMKRNSLSFIKSTIPVSVQNSNNTSESQNTTDDMTILLIIIAIFIPFLAVLLYEGITTRFWISLLLTLLFWLPGAIYAILIVTGNI